MWRSVVSSVLLAFPTAWCQPGSSPVIEDLGLDQAIALALKNNRPFKNAELEIRKSEEELAATRTFRLPSMHLDVLGAQLLTRVDWHFPMGAFGTFPGTGPIPPFNVPISTPRRPAALVMARAGQPISQQYRIGLGIQLRGLERDAAREKARGLRQSIASDVKKAYFGVLQTQSALDALNEGLKLYRELDRVVGESVAQQVALKSESLEIKSRLAKTEYDRTMLQNALVTQREQLNDLLGRDINTEFQVAPPAEPDLEPAALADLRARALTERPDLREARLRLRQAERDRAMKKAEYIPDVSATVAYLSPFNFGVLPKNVMFGGLLFSWDVFDWGRKKHELAAKTLTVEQARNGIKEAETMVAVEVAARYRKLEETRSLLRVVRLGQEAAREKVRLATNRYAQQAGALKDVLQEQATLAEANHQYQQALLSFWTARAELDKAIGEDR